MSFRFVDSAGAMISNGTIEELWGGTHLDKLHMTSNGSELTLVQNEKGTYQEGQFDQKLALLNLLERSLVQPIPLTENSFFDKELATQIRTIGSSSLYCLTVTDHSPIANSFNAPTYCLENSDLFSVLTALRMTLTSSRGTIWVGFKTTMCRLISPPVR